MKMSDWGKVADLLKERTGYMEKIKTVNNPDINLGFIRKLDGHDHIVGTLHSTEEGDLLSTHWKRMVNELEAQVEELGVEIDNVRDLEWGKYRLADILEVECPWPEKQ